MELQATYLNGRGHVYCAAALQLDSSQHTKHRDLQHAHPRFIFMTASRKNIHFVSYSNALFSFKALCRNASAKQSHKECIQVQGPY